MQVIGPLFLKILATERILKLFGSFKESNELTRSEIKIILTKIKKKRNIFCSTKKTLIFLMLCSIKFKI